MPGTGGMPGWNVAVAPGWNVAVAPGWNVVPGSGCGPGTPGTAARTSGCMPGITGLVQLDGLRRWRDYWLAADERQGHPVRIGAVTDQPDAWLTAVANGYGVALAPESAARYYARPGVTYRPVTGVSPSQVGVAWPPGADADPVVQDFVRCCLEATREARPAPGGGVVPGG